VVRRHRGRNCYARRNTKNECNKELDDRHLRHTNITIAQIHNAMRHFYIQGKYTKIIKKFLSRKQKQAFRTKNNENILKCHQQIDKEREELYTPNEMFENSH
jgi:hypothetical protein